MRRSIAIVFACALFTVPALAHDDPCKFDVATCGGSLAATAGRSPAYGRQVGRQVAAAAAAYHGMIDAAAAAAGVPAHIARAVVRHESGFNPNVRGLAGEYGLGQIKCATARSVGFSGSCGSLFDPVTNLRFSMRYLRLALDRGGAGCAGVSLYQRGIYGRASCSAYGRKVMAIAR
jgi:soluble lytic murein transglycosylase-like protein